MQNEDKLRDLLAQAWDELDEEAKQVYFDKEKEDKIRFALLFCLVNWKIMNICDRYERELAAWKAATGK